MLKSNLVAKNILFNMSGSIAAYKACDVISQLVKAGNTVQVVCTSSTFEFVGRATLEGLTGRAVVSDMYESGRAMDHIHLARWADLAILCPASANTLAKFAHGFADDIVSALFLAWEPHKPYVIAPAMNTQMYNNPATQRNLRTVSRGKVTVLSTGTGNLACGEVGEGRLLEPKDILEALAKLSEPTKGKVLVTFGGTREAIDGVRFLTNGSTGKTGAELSDYLVQMGWQVTCLRAEAAVPASLSSDEYTFTDFRSLDDSLRNLLDKGAFEAVIHLAAVSDFSVDTQPGKIPSDRELSLKLRPNFKIVDRLKKYAQPKALKVVAFKLTDTKSMEERLAAVNKLLTENVDLVVHNDVSDLNSSRPMVLFNKAQEPKVVHGTSELAQTLNRFLIGESL
jgi:phosphopantothenoylcysteine decarboxylase/phosphopantothenate--cysteine ligase